MRSPQFGPCWVTDNLEQLLQKSPTPPAPSRPSGDVRVGGSQVDEDDHDDAEKTPSDTTFSACTKANSATPSSVVGAPRHGDDGGSDVGHRGGSRSGSAYSKLTVKIQLCLTFAGLTGLHRLHRHARVRQSPMTKKSQNQAVQPPDDLN